MIKPQAKKTSKQFINHLKDTQNMPLTGTENQNPVKKYYGPIEGDFLKIGCTYILQNDRLTKKSLYGGQKIRQDHNQISEVILQTHDIEVVKEIAKLEYLEKKGYLKPQETQRLQKLKGQSLNSNLPTFEKQPKRIQKAFSPDGKFRIPLNEFDSENFDPNIHYKDYYSPKKQFSSMKSLPNQTYKNQNNYESYQYESPEPYYQANPNYHNQNHSSHSNYY